MPPLGDGAHLTPGGIVLYLRSEARPRRAIERQPRLSALALGTALVILSVRAHEMTATAAFQADVGSRIAFSTDRDGRDAPDEIYVMNADGSAETRLTFTTSGNCLFPEWSPDGRFIAFHNNPDAPGSFEIYVVAADGSGDVWRLTDTASRGLAAFNPTWSPDGRRIAFNSQDALGGRDIYVVDVATGALTQLTSDPANEANPDWSPDGALIAFNSNRSGNADLYLIPAAGGHDPGDWFQLTSSPAADLAAEWSPNGREIAFESQRDGNREIYVMGANGSNQTRLTFDLRADAFPSWSPDGRRIAFHRQLLTVPGLGPPNGSEIFVVGRDGSEETQITFRTPGSFSAFASWAPGHVKELE
jgi:TolB protein